MLLQQSMSMHSQKLLSSYPEFTCRRRRASSLPCTSRLDLMVNNGKPSGLSGRECLCTDGLSLPRGFRVIPEQVGVYTAGANQLEAQSLQSRLLTCQAPDHAWRETIKLPSESRVSRRGD